MNELKLFRQTRLKLAGFYAGAMGLILGVSGLGIYEAIDHAHRISIDRELESIASNLHDSLEPTLTQTSQLSLETQRVLPDLCQASQCSSPIAPSSLPDHQPGEIFRSHYYIALISPQGDRIAQAGLNPEGLPITAPHQAWITLRDRHHQRYRQVTLPLQNPRQPLWGYLQVGSSLAESDAYVARVRLILLVGLPLTLLWVGGASWVLAGQAMGPIYRSFQQMRQFTADVAHELRTPIAASQATLESVQGSDLSSQEIQEILQVMNRQQQRLAQLVRDLLFLTRLDQPFPLPEKTLAGLPVIRLQDVISDIIEELTALTLGKQIQLRPDMRTEDLYVKGHESQLYRLFLNLVMNAIQFTPEGGTIWIILDRREGKAVVQIQDTGIGLALAEQQKIFDRFYRVDGDRSRQSGGSGLGLSIAQAIAQRHKGSISVQSQLNQGSTFTVAIPTL